MTPQDQKPKDEHITKRNQEESFRVVCEAIGLLSPRHYLQLKQWLYMQLTVEDWKQLMKS